ncbi:MAG: Sec-independent protein translocase protein TatB [Thermodesulfobacteriota bacterium]|nr:Sec-independent protein translocase protein TatB [Thermodesulfobacteriota bacterium]
MLNMGMSELLVIFVLALLVIGPKKLPELARILGKIFWEIKNTVSNIKEELRIETLMEEKEHFNNKNFLPENSSHGEDSDEAPSLEEDKVKK